MGAVVLWFIPVPCGTGCAHAHGHSSICSLTLTVSLPRVLWQPQTAVSRAPLHRSVRNRELGSARPGEAITERHSRVSSAGSSLPCVCARGVPTEGDPSLTCTHGASTVTLLRVPQKGKVCVLSSYTYSQHFYNPQMGTRRNLLVQPLLSKSVRFSQTLHLLCSPLHVFPVATGLDTSHPNIFKLSSTPAQAHLELFGL